MKKLLFAFIFSSGLYAQSITSNLTMCEHLNGVAEFDLTLKNEDILSELPSNNYTITYYTTLQDAELGVNAILNPEEYNNIVVNQQTVYARATEVGNNNHSLFQFDLVVNPKPITIGIFLDFIDNQDEDSTDEYALIPYSALTEQMYDANPDGEFEVKFFPDSSLTVEFVPPIDVMFGTTLYYTVKNMATECWGVGVISITVLAPTANITDNKFSNLKYFPNPVKDVLNIENSADIDAISIINILGRTVTSMNNSNQINLSTLNSGIYFVRVSSGNVTNMFKIIKE